MIDQNDGDFLLQDGGQEQEYWAKEDRPRYYQRVV